jgi:DNA-directed RNA polymerase subunit K/omega
MPHQKRYTMLDQKVYLDDVYASKKCDGSSFKAVVMMSKEARFINNQAYQGFIQLEEKPTTIAMNKFKQNKLSVAVNEEK